MLAAPHGSEVPEPDSVSGGLVYEPKWDGFRCLIFRSGDEVIVQGRGGDDLAYCFPEIVAAARAGLPPDIVLDGELVIIRDDRLSFPDLSSRIRPRSEAAGPSIAALAADLPATFIAFDLLALAGRSLMADSFEVRRTALAALTLPTSFHLSPQTRDVVQARDWFDRFEGAGLDGLIAKPLTDPYAPGRRTLLKVKHARTADVVVAGWRAHRDPGPDGQPVVGSLLLGLHDPVGVLHHIGVASSFTAARRAALAVELAAYVVADGEPHPWRHAAPTTRVPGAENRWNRGRNATFVALRPELVAEVGYDQMEGDRLRHVARFLRWRPDRRPDSCTYAQLDRPVRFQLGEILG
jgi:ATP-dependent DNA ligase